jgi:hypothetical protein
VTADADSTRLLTVLRRTAGVLDRHRQPWAPVGGLAVSVRSEPRFTKDIDVAAAVKDDAAAEALVSSLVVSGFRLRLTPAPDRPQDAVDLRALVATLSEADRARARAATSRIEELGANRSKALREELERWLADF